MNKCPLDQASFDRNVHKKTYNFLAERLLDHISLLKSRKIGECRAKQESENERGKKKKKEKRDVNAEKGKLRKQRIFCISAGIIMSLCIVCAVMFSARNSEKILPVTFSSELLKIKSITSHKSYNERYSAHQLISNRENGAYWCSYDNALHQISISLENTSIIKRLILKICRISPTSGFSKDINVFILPHANSTISTTSFAGRIRLNATKRLQIFDLERQIKGNYIIFEFQSLYSSPKYNSLESIAIIGSPCSNS
jgi:hypothetical protein